MIPLHEWMGSGSLLFTYGDKWKKRRLALTPAFHFSILNEFLDIHEKYAEQMVVKLRNVSHAAVDVQKITSVATLGVICETSMGVSVDSMFSESDNAQSVYAKAIERIKQLVEMRFRSPISGK